MTRRTFLLAAVPSLLSGTALAEIAFANRKFLFKIKTKNKSIVGNILIEAKDLFAAIAKLKKRYPDCEILEAREK